MSTTTTNFGLVKPELTDAADITAMNQNWDKIDEKLHKAYSDENKPSPSDIGAAAASSHNIKTYTNLAQLGLSDGATMSQVARALPGSSMLRIYVLTTANQNLAPVATNGWLEVHRPSVNHVIFIYTTSSLKRYVANVLSVGTDSELVNNWSKLATQAELDALTPADIGAAPAYAYQTTDLTAGTSALTTGKMCLVYE